jgi:hypothetical protein
MRRRSAWLSASSGLTAWIFPRGALADTAIPAITGFSQALGLLFAVIVLGEAVVLHFALRARMWPNLKFRVALWTSCLANGASTLVGLPVAMLGYTDAATELALFAALFIVTVLVEAAVFKRRLSMRPGESLWLSFSINSVSYALLVAVGLALAAQESQAMHERLEDLRMRQLFESRQQQPGNQMLEPGMDGGR